MIGFRTFAAGLLLLTTTVANGSFWVSEFRDSAAQYRIVRGNETVPIQQLMLLKTGDTVIIDEPHGQVVIVNERNEYLRLTSGNSPFEVPESESPPRLLVNVRNWVATWWNTHGNQSTSTMAAVSKGGLAPRFSVATSGQNLLLSGAREIRVAWSGGIEPFEVSLLTDSGELLVQQAVATGNTTSLPEVLLQKGQFQLRVAAGDAGSTVDLTVVDREKLPAVAAEIMNLDLPEQILYGHVAMLLSAYGQWRFEALQLAHNYNLMQLEIDLLAGDFPESAPGEVDSISGMPDFAERPEANDD